MKQILYLVFTLLIVIFGLGLAVLTKGFTYNLYYKDLVKQTIIETIRDSSLINPSMRGK